MLSGFALPQPSLFDDDANTARKAARPLAKYWWRVAPGVAVERPEHEMLLDVLRVYKCACVESYREPDSGLQPYENAANEQIAAAAKSSTAISLLPRPVLSLPATSCFVGSQLSQFGAVEWLTYDFHGATDTHRPLTSLRSVRALDVSSADRLAQRIQLIRQSVGEMTSVGLGFTFANVLANLYLLAECDVDFISVTCPTTLLSAGHPAGPWVTEFPATLLGKIATGLRAIGRRDIQVVIQASLQSGYDAGAYFALGASTVVLNNYDWFAIEGRRRDNDLASSFLGGYSALNAQQTDEDALRLRAETFFGQVDDIAAYAGL